MKGPWRNFAYHDIPTMIAFWQRRAREDDGTRRIWYATPSPDHPDDPRKSIKGKPGESLTERCIYVADESVWELLRGRGSRRSDELVWCEGETDADAVDAEGWPAISHHGGAFHSTDLQADKLRHFRGTVFIAADRDFAGYACAARRKLQLLKVGLPGERIEVIAAADERRGADLRSHIERDGLDLSETLAVPPGALWAAHEEFRARAATSGPARTGLAAPDDAFYHGGRGAPTDDEWAAFCRGLRVH